MKYARQAQRSCVIQTRRLLFFMGILAIFILVLETFTLPYGNDFPSGKVLLHEGTNFAAEDAYTKLAMTHNVPFSNVSNMIELSLVPFEASDMKGKEKILQRDLENEFASEKRYISDLDVAVSEEVIDLDRHSVDLAIEVQDGIFRQGNNIEHRKGFSKGNKQAREMLSEADNLVLRTKVSPNSANSTVTNVPIVKKMRCDMPPKTIMTLSEMNHLFYRKRRSSPKMRPEWPSIRDNELVSARSQIMNAPIIRDSRELHAPLFRNVSMFKRSYELMEQILKVYIYKDGKPPIFHQPILKGLYASEGWFMKLMEGNKKFVVQDPTKAHLFYMPFSTRMLEYALYVRNSHNRTNLALYLKNYTNAIASKYSFWNRTNGADHFFVACHDWAPYETRHHMERCVKAMCNADVTQGFKIGKDVSLPETYVRSERNPQINVGGKHPSKRSILAFFAGNMHGYFRPILLQNWKNKDPDMKIFGPMPQGVAKKMSYIQHMKSSKYCICAKGYEVNSPRVVESILYECVPVIISDNFVPPFFEVLDWEAFSVIVAEKDVPKLKDILLSIPENKYLEMQLAVKKVQRHFFWHRNPVKYDLFHMTLHSIWYNRIFQIKPR